MADLRNTADLELSLAPLKDGLGLSIRFTRHNDAESKTLPPALTRIAPQELLALSDDARAYGELLAAQLFADKETRRFFGEARAIAQQSGMHVRVRLHLHDPLLHQLRWETIHDAMGGAPLALDSQLALSRYLTGADWGRVELRPRSQMRALVAVAAPEDLERYKLAAIDASAELSRTRAALIGLELDELPASGARCTLESLGARLRAGAGYDLLYLIAHGNLLNDTPLLYLEDEGGGVKVVDGANLADLFRSLDERRPRLVVLASCESAGDGFADALASLGPLLAWAGVPAVLAMQGNVQIETVARFAPVFFTELLRDGLADRALAVARLAVREQADWWMPVLYTRLREGRIWADEARPAIFMPPDLPRDFVPRPAELNELKRLLLGADSGPKGERRLQPGVVAVHGFGGYGKTGLAQMLCHDGEVRRACARDGILWASLGQSPGESGLLEWINTWLQLLSGQNPELKNLTAAQARLRDELASREMLIVIDDVWSATDLEPFLQGGPRCARLITTRDTRTLPENATRVAIGRMSEVDALAFLRAGLPSAHDDALARLVDRLGSWPILLRLVRSNLQQRVLREHQDMDEALVEILDQLGRNGLAVFDPSPDARSRAVAATVNLSLDRLTAAQRQRYAELCAFPPDLPIPLDVLTQLWRRTGGVAKADVGRLCSELFQLSLLLSFDRAQGMIRLHDVLHSYLRATLEGRAAVHLTIVDMWGRPPRPPSSYAWRWLGYHLAEAAKMSPQPLAHDLAAQLVRLAGDEAFQHRHKELVKDIPALQSVLVWAMEAAVTDRSPGGLPLLATAARQIVRFRRAELRPEPLFALAKEGRVVEAERQAGLFDLEPEWRQALLLTIAWLGASAGVPESLELYRRLEQGPASDTTTQRLRQWAEVDLIHAPAPGPQLERPPSQPVVAHILNRIGGGNYDAELLIGHGLQAGAPNPSMIAPGGSYGSTTYIVEEDGPWLVAYAASDEQLGDAVFDAYLSVFTNYNYPEYRFRSLWLLLGHVLRHPNGAWVQKTVQKVLITALGGGSVEFEQALAVAVLALRAKLGEASAVDALTERGQQLWEAAGRIQYERQHDSWAHQRRHMLAVAQACACLQIASELVAPLLHGAERIAAAGFAGYSALANLALADTARICQTPDEEAITAAALNAAQTAAHNIQDAAFCARITARVNAMRAKWYGPLDPYELSQGLREIAHTQAFAALHYVGHAYEGRQANALPFPAEMREARTLAELAQLYGRRLSALVALNSEQGWGANQHLPPNTPIYMPDPGFAPHLAARLAGAALVDMSLAPDERIELIRSLVSIALPSPTALDTVLARLALAWGMGEPESMTPELIAALESEAPLDTTDDPLAPLGELIA